MNPAYKKLLISAEKQFTGNRKLVARLRKLKSGELDAAFLQLHEEAFSHINCLECANCCKTISPIIKQQDMDRMAKYLNVSVTQVLTDYIEMDEDSDFVMNQTPCPFLEEDNKCRIYAARPEACRGYPHTNRRKMRTILNLALKNSKVCPAAAEIFSGLSKI